MMKNKLEGDLKISPIVYLIVAIFILVVIITFIFSGWNKEINTINEENNLRGECIMWISAETGPCVDKLDIINKEGEFIYPYLNKTYGVAKEDEAKKACLCP